MTVRVLQALFGYAPAFGWICSCRFSGQDPDGKQHRKDQKKHSPENNHFLRIVQAVNLPPV